MATQNLPARNNVAEIRTLLEKSRKQFEMALPKHLPADRLLRVAMTSIQRNPLLVKCTQTSLLACIMTCAQLGLEPDQFLGQAYLIPFKNNKKGGIYECQIIPGYRGYISLARRTGEVQTLSAQVVYENDEFSLCYGTEDKLEHRPAMNGDRGQAVGAYCVIKYKDGGYSFDFMSKGDIEKIRKRSKAANDGPWVTDWDEMAKKTVIRRHIKLAPLSIEFQTAAVLEDRAMTGESQMDLIGSFGTDEDVIDAETSDDKEALLKEFEDRAKEVDPLELDLFIGSVAEANKSSNEAVKVEAAKQPEAFWKAFSQFQAKQQAKTKPVEPEQETRFECPQGGYVTASICRTCEKLTDKSGERCPAAPEK
ncbi:MAG: recombination and repair protein RecT [Syntrophus sp. PtaB.Bin075]|nr:MAG: recombination and repair protein RecT [Syntrophus sp. PtaB.Bin075]